MLHKWDYWLYPDLQKFTAAEQALRDAKETPFDTLEMVGIAVALVLTIAITRYSTVGMTVADRVGAVLGNFLVALPALAVFAGPFYIRRVRRGLSERLRRSSGP